MRLPILFPSNKAEVLTACKEGVGGGAVEEIMMTRTQSQTNSNTNLALLGHTGREVDHEGQPNVSHDEGAGENAIHKMNSGHSRSQGMYSILLGQWLSQ